MSDVLIEVREEPKPRRKKWVAVYDMAEGSFYIDEDGDFFYYFGEEFGLIHFHHKGITGYTQEEAEQFRSRFREVDADITISYTLTDED